ncbi:hypothetical protein [Methanogenium cariaci]|uniref:hypothetical protein n=1 Tax=Methanogenium cariaci TaxID=2197 RepID=UPI0007852E0A|nr:hypothetical protein [Methanogenium cariaci]
MESDVRKKDGGEVYPLESGDSVGELRKTDEKIPSEDLTDSPELSPDTGDTKSVLGRLNQHFRSSSGKQIELKLRDSLRSILVQKGKDVTDPIEELIPEKVCYHHVTPPLPPLEPGDEQVIERYWLNPPPFTYAKIVKTWDMDFEYEVVEPKISEQEYVLLEETYEELRNVLIYTSSLHKENVRFDESRVKSIIRNFDPEITDDRLDILIYFLRCNFAGFGKLDPPDA